MKSRSFTIVDVPETSNLKANFVYNFFTPDERVNDAGDSRIRGASSDLQKMIDSGSLQHEVPRYVEVSFAHVSSFGSNFADAKNQAAQNEIDISKVDTEETVTNVGFASLRESDDNAVPRIKQKLDALSKMMGSSFQDSDQSKKLADILGVPQDDVQSVITPLGSDGFVVNAKEQAAPVSVFLKAEELKLNSQINKRLMGACVNSADDVSPLSRVQVTKEAKSVTQLFKSTATSHTLFDEDEEPVIQATSAVQTPDAVGLLAVTSVGYILTRYRYSDDGSKAEAKVFFLPGNESTKYLDAQVVYGSSYSYEARAVYQVDAVIQGNVQFDNEADQKNVTNWRVSYLLASRACPSVRVNTEEFQAPKEPDGVFFDFDYDNESGLVIKWQVPAGRSRDVKYFQVFRRKTIFDPFACIAQLEFDDSVIRTVIPEQVNPHRRMAYPGPRTVFEDFDFTRNDKYIYAVAAVDAHGLTSGYSAQTEVGFDKVKNILTLKSISRGGAPKQYPNFYVDPKLDDNIAVDSFTQDAIFDSGHKKMSVYFTPDARVMSSAGENSESVFHTDGSYSFHFINLDLQKSDVATFVVKDLRKLK